MLRCFSQLALHPLCLATAELVMRGLAPREGLWVGCKLILGYKAGSPPRRDHLPICLEQLSLHKGLTLSGPHGQRIMSSDPSNIRALNLAGTRTI